MVGLQRYESAIQDVERAMMSFGRFSGVGSSKRRKNSESKAFAIMGEAHYHMGEFERSLMHFHRSLHRCQSGIEEDEIRSLTVIGYWQFIRFKMIKK